MKYSKQYDEFYSKYDFLLRLAAEGVIKDIESLKDGIMYAYNMIENRCEDGMMPDDIDGDGVMQCKTLSLSYEVEAPEDFMMWMRDYYCDWKHSIDMISSEFEEELAKLRALQNEILGLKMKEDEEGNVSSLDRLRIYIKTILDLMDNGDSYDTCIELFKYAERIEAEMPNEEEAEDVVKVMDAIRNVIAQNPRVSRTLRKIVDNEE